MKIKYSLKTFLLRILLFSILLYCFMVAFIYFYQEKLLFQPTRLGATHTFNLPDVREVKVSVPGATLSALHYKRPDPRGIIFFLHGNAGSLQNWLTNTSFYEKANYDLFMLDYRGYGKSTGAISSEEQLMNDIRISWESVSPQYDGKIKIIYGRSLGTALAAHLSIDTKPDLTVLVSPYYSMSEMAKIYYPWAPGIILRYPLDTAKYVRSITNPILIFHGDKDKLIPLEQSQRLEKENNLARLIIVHEAEHDNIHTFKSYSKELLSALHGH